MKKLFYWFRSANEIVIYTYSGLLIAYFSLRILSGDRLWPLALFGNLIPWILLPIFCLPILGFLARQQKRFILVSSIACLILLGWLNHHYWSPKNASISASSKAIAVLSLNVSWHSTPPETLVNVVETRKPDLVFLQEITYEHIRDSFPKLKTIYPYQAYIRQVCLLSKYPIIFSEKIHLAGHKEVQQRAIIQLPQQEIVVYNVQTTSPWIFPEKILPFLRIPTYQYGARSLEIRDLVQRIQQETLPVIAAGDFNLTDQTEDYLTLQNIMQDAFKTSGFGFGSTWPNGFPLKYFIKKTDWKLNYPLFRIDYIWYSPHFGSRNSQVLPSIGSEHLPVAAVLVWDPANQIKQV